MLTLRRLPAAASRHPDPLLRLYFDQLGDHWPAHRWLLGRSMAGPLPWSEAARLCIAAAEWRLIEGRVEPEHYVSMEARRGIHRLINPAAVPIRSNMLKDKAAFARFAIAHGLPAPLTAAAGLTTAAAKLLERGDIVMKPSFSSQGKGVVRARRQGRRWQLTTGEEISEMELALRMEQVATAGGVTQEALAAHPALAGLSPGALPTVRVMTFRLGNAVPVMGFSAIRLGGGGAPVDNFDRGGLLAMPSRAGELTEAFSKGNCGRLVRTTVHPSSGEPIARALPTALLESAAALAVEAHARLQEGLSLIGWDLGLSDCGPVLIEGNWNPGTQLPQCAAGAGLSQMPMGDLYREALERVERHRWRRARPIEIDW